MERIDHQIVIAVILIALPAIHEGRLRILSIGIQCHLTATYFAGYDIRDTIQTISRYRDLADLILTGRDILPDDRFLYASGRFLVRRCESDYLLIFLSLSGEVCAFDMEEEGRISRRWIHFLPIDPVSYTHLDVYKRQILD